MRRRLRKVWPVLKLLLGLAILYVIGRQFARDLQRPDLWQRPLHPGWCALSGVLYLLGLGFSALYWRRLLGHFGQRPPLGMALRAYYIGHMGKYLPGKAWAVILRCSLVRGSGVRLGVAALTTLYEVLTTMAAGVLVAVLLFAFLAPDTGGDLDPEAVWQLLRLQPPASWDGGVDRRAAVLLSLALLLPLLIPLLPPVFNRLVHHLSLPFRDRDTQLPRIRFAHLAEGLVLAGVGWLFLGASLGAVLHAILGPDFPWTGPALGRLPAIMGLSYVAGFVILFAPSGLGVREFFLTLLLTPELMGLMNLEVGEARGLVVLAVLLLRLVWTLAELVIVTALYWSPRKEVVGETSSR